MSCWLIATGVLKLACCQPDSVSPVAVVEARSVPVVVQRLTLWLPVMLGSL